MIIITVLHVLWIIKLFNFPPLKLFLDDSDNETTSSFQGKLSSSKKERHFWQYNVQSKGPKGQKIMIQTSINDPHVLNEIVDPVFSGGVELQGIKHR